MRKSKPKSRLRIDGGRGPRRLLPYVCFTCRKSFKRGLVGQELADKKCPNCGGVAIGLSRKFKPPLRSDAAQWKKVEYLVAHGFRFFSQRDLRTGATTPYPATLAEARIFVRRFGGSRQPFRIHGEKACSSSGLGPRS
jgi:predicted RNA-binding Zn-ribbon protein involved in translation (DUF1610 family)